MNTYTITSADLAGVVDEVNELLDDDSDLLNWEVRDRLIFKLLDTLGVDPESDDWPVDPDYDHNT
jgi:hypothetical protein